MSITTCLAVALLLGQAKADEPKPEKEVDKVQLERWQKYYRTVAGEYEMLCGRDLDTKLQLHANPAVTYFNPVGGTESYGSIFVWTREGRPEIAGAIWSRRYGNERSVIHSFHSLSLEPLSARRRGGVFWARDKAGVEPLKIPDAPAPAASPQLRLAQMRSLAREFTASTVRGTAERELRFLPQPAFRFDEPSVESDGSLFVWFEDWDPELLMLIESRATPDGPKWHASFGRFTPLLVTARHKGAKVWSFEPGVLEPSLGGHGYRYISVHGVDVLPHLRNE